MNDTIYTLSCENKGMTLMVTGEDKEAPDVNRMKESFTEHLRGYRLEEAVDKVIEELESEGYTCEVMPGAVIDVEEMPEPRSVDVNEIGELVGWDELMKYDRLEMILNGDQMDEMVEKMDFGEFSDDGILFKDGDPVMSYSGVEPVVKGKIKAIMPSFVGKQGPHFMMNMLDLIDYQNDVEFAEEENE